MTTSKLLREWIDAVISPVAEANTDSQGYKKGDRVVVVSNATSAKGKSGTVFAAGKADGLISDGYLAVELDDGNRISVSTDEVVRDTDLEKIPADPDGHGMYELTLTFEKDGNKEIEVDYVPISFSGAVLHRQSVIRMARDSDITKERLANGWRLVGHSARAVHR
jgi:hypothetical protein